MTTYPSLSIVGGLLPADLFTRIAEGSDDVPATSPESYGLERTESVPRQASRCWPYLQDMWQDFKDRKARTPEANLQRLTRRWLQILLRELGFTSLVANGGFEIDGKRFPISHRSNGIPLHLLGWKTDLDHRTKGLAGAARAPQSMVQELLNRSEECLWAILSNGSKLRVLRDSTSLVGAAYVEFDLEAIFEGELFSDFRLLWLVCHRSRFEATRDGAPPSCPLELWRGFAAELAGRALGDLRTGVETAVSVLGTGFLSHPYNGDLHHRIASGDLDQRDFNRAILRLIYRLLFWFVAEDRDVLLLPSPEDADGTTRKELRLARERYHSYFSATRLRRLARSRRGSRNTDLWESVQLVFTMLSLGKSADLLSLPGLGGIFEPTELDAPLQHSCLGNDALLQAIHALCLTQSSEDSRLRPVDFVNLGSEELGSVYESLLELHPDYDDEYRVYKLVRRGNERKMTGSYFTPPALVDCLLDEALEPLLDQACTKSTPAERVEALLNVTVCDPACGSGHFLVAAARRIAKRVAIEESGDPEPPAADVRAALRRVLGPCIYGVDINPLAAELARLSLCLEAMEPGKPLNFLEPNIRIGNSLLGVTPNLLRDPEGIPDVAFYPLPLDDRKAAAGIKKENRFGRSGNRQLPAPIGHTPLRQRAASIAKALPDSLPDLYATQRQEFEDLRKSPEWRSEELLADGWCAAFVQRKTLGIERGSALTTERLSTLFESPEEIDAEYYEGKIRKLASEYRFFHWHLEFPHIFWNGAEDINPDTGWTKGFSCVVGNPPWERIKLQEQEFFALVRPDIAKAPNAAARKRLIASLAGSGEEADRKLFMEYQLALRRAAGWSHLLSRSGRYPLTGHGDINTYAVFAETALLITGPKGRMGMILPTGIATDATTAPFFANAVRRSALVSFLDFENEAFLLSRDVDHRLRFCLLTVAGRSTPVEMASFAFGSRYMADLESRRFTLRPENILLVNPNTGTCPLFRSRRDAAITIGIYRRVPVLRRTTPEIDPWRISFMAMFHMANDSGLFCTGRQLEESGWTLNGNIFFKNGKQMLPLYEAKMVHHYDHRLGTYDSQTQAQANRGTLPRLTLEQKNNPNCAVTPRYWVPREAVDEKWASRSWDRSWFLGWRDICRTSDSRTCISTIVPGDVACEGGILIALPGLDAQAAINLASCLASFVLDYVSRQKVGGTHLKFFQMRQLPVLKPSFYQASCSWDSSATIASWLTGRTFELLFTSHDMKGFALDLDDEGEPFRWDEQRRALLRAELDAAYFHFYGIERDDVDYIMETFPIVKRRDEAAFGEYRTKRLILAIYDAMDAAMRSGVPYQTLLDPPPGQGPRHQNQ